MMIPTVPPKNLTGIQSVVTETLTVVAALKGETTVPQERITERNLGVTGKIGMVKDSEMIDRTVEMIEGRTDAILKAVGLGVMNGRGEVAREEDQ